MEQNEGETPFTLLSFRLVTSPFPWIRAACFALLPGLDFQKSGSQVKQIKGGLAGLKSGISAKFPEREIFHRSGGQVKFIKIGTKVQMLAAGGMATALGGWLAVTLVMMVSQGSIASERAAIARQSQTVAKSSRQVNAYRASVSEIADDLEARQAFLEETTKSIIGGGADAAAVVGKAPEKSDARSAAGQKISSTAIDAHPLAGIERRQLAFARLLTGAVKTRTQKAEAAIRGFGLDPNALARRTSAQGGPFIPWHGDRDSLTSELKQLSVALARLDILENGLVAIPSGKPTATPMLSSSYGYRRDPFNGRAAFHAGLDFPGAYGQPILAAARGRVSYVGPRQGYGNVVEIDHGNGILTRYAHLSRADTKVGATVMRGDDIARMGSTGRSTGTHLHFEVRVNGEAINPRRFLEADRDVLQVQQIAKQRFADVGHRS